MYTVYHQDKKIVFVPDSKSVSGPLLPWPAVPCGNEGIAKVLQNLENNKTLYITTHDPEAAFGDFTGYFSLAEAAGGLVRNPQQELLMICRNGRWDLPKGHREAGETGWECAVREVFEECGVWAFPQELLTVTLHFYLLGRIWTIKRTEWYEMEAEGSIPVPQTEEGITEVRWLDGKTVLQNSTGAFLSVRDVLFTAGFI